MLKHRYIDKICCFVMVICLAVALLLGNLSFAQAENQMGYETRLFDTSRVHTIDLVMEDWEGFLATCTDEQYVACSVVIDGEAYKNVGIRAKGNSSLTTVQSYGNNRYSFKIEFDKYHSGGSYYGLDKLALNNIVQDNTYLKDYLSYTLMARAGVASPLCSFVYITVNGEDWGLYLAVEGVEEAFLQRNYGSNYGKLYKPDSTDMGGGGAGAKGDFSPENPPNFGDGQPAGSFSGNGQPPVEDDGAFDGNGQPPELPQGFQERNAGNMEPAGNPPGGQNEQGGRNGEALPKAGESGDALLSQGQEDAGNAPAEGETPGQNAGNRGFGNRGGFGGGMGSMGSSDVKLQYIDDDPASYSNIFENSKTDVTEQDQQRLIASLKALSEGDASAVDIEQVIRYFAVHNFLCNDDSYTGSIVHNYYLYEKDGQLAMIPWDYNLAFGGFGGGDATGQVNLPIDSPVSSGELSDRPMVAWIFEDEQYTQQYHQVYKEFLQQFEDGSFIALVDETAALISPYVEKDPTAFCSFEEFEQGVAVLKEFCLLRADSVEGQLDGAIPSTTEGQRENGSALVDASHLSLSAMGNNNEGGGNRGGFERQQGQLDGQEAGNSPAQPEGNAGEGEFQPAQRMAFPEMGRGEQPGSGGSGEGQQLILLLVSGTVLLAGVLVAKLYKKW